jgi:hypothetical protein
VSALGAGVVSLVDSRRLRIADRYQCPHDGVTSRLGSWSR